MRIHGDESERDEDDEEPLIKTEKPKPKKKRGFQRITAERKKIY